MAADGTVLIRATLDTTEVGKGVKKINEELQGITWKDLTEGNDRARKLSGTLSQVGTAMTVSLTVPIMAAGGAALDAAAQWDDATGRMQAATGGTREEAEALAEVGRDLYSDGWGQSIDDVTTSLIEARSVLGDVSDEDLGTVTEAAYTLADAFGADMNESMRGVDALMEGFGLTAEEACDLMVAGSQRGLDYTHELGDNLAEYAGRWGDAGISASQYFSLLEAGAQNGAYSLDKVGDFLNEFLTSLTDGRMEASISNFSQGTQDLWEQYKTGGATAQEMLDAVIGDMQGMTSETDRARLASDLWSSLGEDNAMAMILALGGVEDSFGDVSGAAGEAGNAVSDDLGTQWDTAMRQMQDSLVPFAEPAVEIFKQLAGAVQGLAEWFSTLDPGVQQLIVGFALVVAALGPLLAILGPIIAAMPAIVAGVGAVVAAMSPVGVVISAVILAVLYLWDTSEGFRSFWLGVWEAVSGAAASAWESVSGYLSGIWSSVQYAMGVIAAVTSDPFGALEAAGAAVMGWFQSNFPGLSSIVGGAIGAVQALFTDPFAPLRNAVTSVISWVKSNFKLPEIRFPEIKIPHIPLPHFSISGSFSIVPPSMPTIGVDWYAKGGYFDKAAVVGIGEAGPEFALPARGHRMRPFAQAVADEMGDDEVAALLRQLIRDLPGIVSKYSARTIVWNKREVARLIWEVQQ